MNKGIKVVISVYNIYSKIDLLSVDKGDCRFLIAWCDNIYTTAPCSSL